MHKQISLLEAGPRPIAAVRVTTILSKWPGEFMLTLDKVYAAVKAGRVHKGGHNVMVYRPRTDGQTDIECGIEVAEKFESFDEIAYSEIPGGPVAAYVHMGPYQELGAGHKAIIDWCRGNGHRLSGTCWEIYGDWDEDPAKLRTDIFHQLG